MSKITCELCFDDKDYNGLLIDCSNIFPLLIDKNEIGTQLNDGSFQTVRIKKDGTRQKCILVPGYKRVKCIDIN
jgi:hypothetical protein